MLLIPFFTKKVKIISICYTKILNFICNIHLKYSIVLVSFTYVLHPKFKSVTNTTFRKWSTKYTIPSHKTHPESHYNLYIVCDHSPPLILFQVSLNLSELKMPTISNIIKKGQRSKYTAFPLSLVTLISAWINGIFKWVTRISIAKQYMCNIPELPLSHAMGIKVFCYTSYSKLTKNQFIIGWNWFYLIVNSGFLLLKVFIYITN